MQNGSKASLDNIKNSVIDLCVDKKIVNVKSCHIIVVELAHPIGKNKEEMIKYVY